MAIINDDEFTEVEGRYYANPQTILDESNQFIDNLRSTQQANNQEIQTQTYNLGSELPSQLGGLGAPGDTSLSYFTSRYQTPQTTSAVANLRATAQAAALNQVLANEQAKWQKRYNDAYRKYQKSAYDKSLGGYQQDVIEGGVDENDTSKTIGSVDPSFSPLDYSGSYLYNYEPNGLGDSLMNNVNANPSGPVSVTRNSAGDVISLTYNGKTFSGDAAQKRYDYLSSTGTMTGTGE